MMRRSSGTSAGSISRMEEAEAHRAAFAAHAAATALAEARKTKIVGRVQELLGEVPQADAVGVDVAELGPARARLVVGLRWLELSRVK
jgi:hypothetical protein